MSGDPAVNEIAHVVFTDYVGYSRLTMERKKQLDDALLAAVRDCPAVAGVAADRRILLDRGDGLSTVFFGDPQPAAEVADYLFKKVAMTSAVPVRIGCHSGPISHRIDVSGQPAVTGPGIEKAQRIMSLADGSCVLCSEFFAENLAAYEKWRDRFVFVDALEVKHGEKIRVWKMLPVDGVLDPSLSAKPLKIALIYKRNTQPDLRLLDLLERDLTLAGHDVFIDRHLRIGISWAQEIEKQLRGADAVIVLLSDRAAGSEMVLYEVQTALSEQEKRGKPIVLPVRIGTQEPLDGELGALLGRFHFSVWNEQADDRHLVAELHRSLIEPPKQLEPVAPLEQAGGAVPLDSPYYIIRKTDEQFLEALNRRDSIVLVKGARQMGKTSLLARGIQLCRTSGSRIVVTDFQTFSGAQLDSDEMLYRALAQSFVLQLGLKADPRDSWNDWLGANMNLDQFIQKQVLEPADRPVVWAMDEVDRLFTRPYATDFFGMIRSWHNRRALDPDGPWSKLSLAIVYATEAHLFISDLNQSPFNVGTRLALSDFDIEQVEAINRKYGSPLRSPDETSRLVSLFGGQPFLTRRALDDLVQHGTRFRDLEEHASEDEGPFGDHLRRFLVAMSNDATLCGALQKMLHGESPQPEAFYRLRSAGLLAGDSPAEARFRCEIYASYFSRHLG